MRQRHIRNRDKILEECGAYLAGDPRKMRGHWREAFAAEGPLKLELGSGKGRFITQMAQSFPGTNFIASEGQYNVYPRILQKAKALELTNMLLLAEYIADPSDFFGDGEIDGLYLNFSDPWKKKTANRRLTYRTKLEGYKRICAPGAALEFKTDNDALFEFSLEELAAVGLVPEVVEYDLHASKLAENNIMTEYEEKFTENGAKIKFLRVILR